MRWTADGQVISADAFLAFSVPGACYTQNAVFSPHAASYLGVWPARTMSEMLANMLLPEPLREWFKGHRDRVEQEGRRPAGRLLLFVS